MILTFSQCKFLLKLRFHIKKKDGDHGKQKLICHKIFFAEFVFSSPKTRVCACLCLLVSNKTMKGCGNLQLPKHSLVNKV